MIESMQSKNINQSYQLGELANHTQPQNMNVVNQPYLDSGDAASAINFSQPADLSPTSATQVPGQLTPGQELSQSPIMQMVATLSQLIQSLTQMIENLFNSSNPDNADESDPAPTSAPASSAKKPTEKSPVSASGAEKSEKISSNSGDVGNKGISMESGELEIGKNWGGWDGVSDGTQGSSHDVEDRAALVGMLTQQYGFNNDQAHQVAQHIHASARSSGLDATKGVHSESEAADIKTKNHNNLEAAFNDAPPGSSFDEVIASVDSVYA